MPSFWAQLWADLTVGGFLSSTVVDIIDFSRNAIKKMIVVTVYRYAVITDPVALAATFCPKCCKPWLALKHAACLQRDEDAGFAVGELKNSIRNLHSCSQPKPIGDPAIPLVLWASRGLKGPIGHRCVLPPGTVRIGNCIDIRIRIRIHIRIPVTVAATATCSSIVQQSVWQIEFLRPDSRTGQTVGAWRSGKWVHARPKDTLEPAQKQLCFFFPEP